MRVFDPRDSAYAVNLTCDRHIYISREISIEQARFARPISLIVTEISLFLLGLVYRTYNILYSVPRDLRLRT